MLKIYIGPYDGVSRKKAEEKIVLLKKSGMKLLSVNDSTFSKELATSYLGATDLFGERTIVFFDRVFSNEEAFDFFNNNLKTLVSSFNEFIFFEEKLGIADTRLIEEEGGEVFSEKNIFKKNSVETFNIFALGDALGTRRKKDLWVLYTKALRAGKTPEEISGTLFWQIKSILLVIKGGGKNLNPFVRSKASRFAEKYTEEELTKMSFSLVDAYHKSRERGLPLREKLEEFILRL